MKPTRPRAVWVMTLAVALTPVLARADWTQWRGPNRDGIADPSVAVDAWPEALSLTWRHEIGTGHATPVVADGRVYTHSRQGEDEVVTCLTLDAHEIVWRKSYPAPYEMNPAARGHGPGPKSSPVLADGTLVTLGISGVLSAFDADTGDVRWQKRYDDRFGATSPVFGAAMSPLIDGDVVIAHVGGDGDGALVALDLTSGEERWAWDGDGPGYASPVAVEIDGVRQYVTQTQRQVVSVDAGSGALLWSMPYTTPYEQNAITPVAYKDTILLSGLEAGLVAIRARQGADGWATEEVWRNAFSMYMSSPVLSDSRLLGLAGNRKGQFFCLDADTGETLWETEGREGNYAGIVRVGDVFVCLTPDADLRVIRDDAVEYNQVAHYPVANTPTWAHPVVLDGRILVKDEDSLSPWSLR